MYATAQSASMGGVATGVVATLGGTTVGSAIAAVAVPVAAILAARYGVPRAQALLRKRK